MLTGCGADCGCLSSFGRSRMLKLPMSRFGSPRVVARLAAYLFTGVYVKDVEMGMIIVATEETLPEDKIRGLFRVELRKVLGQPA